VQALLLWGSAWILARSTAARGGTAHASPVV